MIYIYIYFDMFADMRPTDDLGKTIIIISAIKWKKK